MLHIISNFAGMSMKNVLSVLLCPVLLIFNSCKLFKNNTTPAPTAVSEAAETDSNSALKLYRASRTKEWELVNTAIDIHFNLPERTADATTRLSLHPYFYSVHSVVLDAKDMLIHSVSDNKNNKLAFSYDSLKLTIHLPKVYSQSDTLFLTIAYKAMPYLSKAGGSSAINEDRGLYFINTNHEEPYLPVQIWTQGESEANSHWFPTFDNPVFKSTFSITMHVPDSFKTLSNGTLVESVKEAGDMRKDVWKQDLPISTYLAMMAAGNYAISKESWRGREVSYYVPQEYGAYAKDIFQHTPEMMEFFSNKLGVDYPWNKYAQVIGYQYVSGAMENVSASLFGAFNLKDRRELDDDNNDFIVAHELFHQWFGDYVTAESWSNLTLNESFADYSEQLWTEYKYGEDARAAYWMQGLAKYMKQAKYNDPALLRFHYMSQEDLFDRISYSKGGLILHYLRSLAGDKAFYNALHLYLSQNAYQNAEVPQLRMAFEKVTGQDWNWFFNQWYYKGGHPVLNVEYLYDDPGQKLKVVISQVQPDSIGLYILPMKTLIINDNETNETWWISQHKIDTFTVDYKNGQKPVVVPDVAHWILGEWKENKQPREWYIQYKNAGDHISKRFALTALAAYKGSDTTKMVYEMALEDKDPVIRALAIGLYQYENKPKISDSWKNLLGRMAANDADSKVRSKALHALGDLEEKEFINTYEISINDSSYRVAADALYALNKVNHKRAVTFARALHPENSKANALLFSAATVISMDGETNDFEFFKDKTMHVFERDRKTFLNAFQSYLIKAKENETYTAGIDFIKEYAIKNIAAIDGLYYAEIIRNLQKYAQSQAKIATDKEQMEKWQLRAFTAQNAWASYKSAIADEDLKEAAAQVEKED
ncbi:M1 family metallopeptidase [Taibaiella lutea]|uniref:Aminopeptidase N n=1 Tax=Taibaiella lutea TaxID=2608001 RepID=A0A5M6CLK1_9BACT|nr:M1 family metallopeptidase [Taibaiella lutea]KAA5536098.1 M1 family metallopeptidase [Taibaiella lutea]